MERKLPQAELDKLIRQHAGRNAVEELVVESRLAQAYRLSDGALLTITKNGKWVFIERK